MFIGGLLSERDNKDVRKSRNVSVSWNEEKYGSRKDLENGCWLEFRFLPKFNCWKKTSPFVKPLCLTCCERKDFSWSYTKLLRPDEQQQSLTFPSHGIPFKQQIWFGSHNLVILLLSILNLTFSFHSPIGPQNNPAD